jgi:hypothetical protein
MFWNFLLSGMKVLAYWETYAAVTILLASFLIPITIVGLTKGKQDCSGVGFKCLNNFLLPALQVCGVTVFVLILAPIILGISEHASWNFPWRIISLAPKEFMLFVGGFGMLAVVSTFSPFLRQLYSFQTMLTGCMSLVLVQKFLSMLNPTMDLEMATVIPGFWFLMGIMLMTGVLSKAGLYFSKIIGDTLADRLEMGKGVVELMVFPVTATCGLIPVFTYGAWLA